MKMLLLIQPNVCIFFSSLFNKSNSDAVMCGLMIDGREYVFNNGKNSLSSIMFQPNRKCLIPISCYTMYNFPPLYSI